MERKKITFSAKIEPVEKLNDEFLKCKVYVCALGKNRNLSHLSREAADEALYSLYNIPVIGHMYEGADGKLHMGGHDMTIAQTDSGAYVYKSLCVPYGVVPSQDNVHYEDIQEPNGDTKTYIVADCILWVGRFPELMEAVYSDDWLFSQSMEINVNDYAALAEDENYTDILHYTYSALCLLGRSDDQEYNTEPCFPESRVSINYEFENDDKFTALMEEFKKDLSECFSSDDSGKEEKPEMTNEVETILVEPAEPVEIQNAILEVSESAAEETLVEFAVEQNDVGTAGEETHEIEHHEAFTFRERLDALEHAMPSTDEAYYYVCDFDDNYAYVCKYTGDGEHTNGRFAYSYDEDAKQVTLTGEFELMFVRWLTQTESDELNSMRNQYEELQSYKAHREQSDREHALDEALAAFADLTGNEEFDVIAANKYSYESVEALQNACYIVRGKYGLIQKTHKTSEPSVPVGAPREPLTPREKLHAAYGRR